MSNRIEKYRSRLRHFKIIFRDIALEPILRTPVEITPYHYCKSKGFICFACSTHSNRSKYVYDNQSFYDVQGLSIS